jgi:ATP-dependent protease ClpP protease subunit
VNRHVQSLTDYKSRLIARLSNLDSGLAAGLKEIKLPWYTITNQADEESTVEEEAAAQILIYDEIGGSFGVSAADFVEELNGITSSKIDVRINSPGGAVWDAIAIYNALIKHPATITTYVDALAASAASIVALAGDQVVMMVGSQMMIHDALGAEIGNAADMRAMAKFLDQQSDNIASMYAVKAGGELKDWRALMLAETWLMATEAVDMGLADEVYKPEPKQEVPADVDPEGEVEEEEPDEGEESIEDEETEEDVTALLKYRHNLTNRGFKYAGRRRAPQPIINFKSKQPKGILQFAKSGA